eukprot:GHVU01074102.1.p1 GENE.GHVU01074102.1~~GHVU01074102.1.p1  ORF type:complete len:144 (-),score=8.77 GHVU01074102.1:522-953(-)
MRAASLSCCLVACVSDACVHPPYPKSVDNRAFDYRTRSRNKFRRNLGFETRKSIVQSCNDHTAVITDKVLMRNEEHGTRCAGAIYQFKRMQTKTKAPTAGTADKKGESGSPSSADKEPRHPVGSRIPSGREVAEDTGSRQHRK